jgi:hypothetical protein
VSLQPGGDRRYKCADGSASGRRAIHQDAGACGDARRVGGISVQAHGSRQQHYASHTPGGDACQRQGVKEEDPRTRAALLIFFHTKFCRGTVQLFLLALISSSSSTLPSRINLLLLHVI